MSIVVIARPARANRESNPYNARIADHLEGLGVQLLEHGIGTVLARRADIVHIHWPERAFTDGALLARLGNAELFAGLAWQRRRGAQVVWTAHNLRAHERRHPEAEERFWPRFLAYVDGVIALGDSGLERVRALRPQIAQKRTFVIPHPHYRGEYPDAVDRAAARAQLNLPIDAPVIVSFGRIRSYKNIPGLVEACAAAEGLHLVVAGAPHSRAERVAVEDAARGARRVHLDLRFLGDEEAQVYLRAADVVALQYRDPLNSGAALLALSFDRPVWMPAGSLADELDACLPPGWILRGPLTPAGALEATGAARALPERTQGAHLASFDPRRVAEAHAQAYRTLLERPR